MAKKQVTGQPEAIGTSYSSPSGSEGQEQDQRLKASMGKIHHPDRSPTGLYVCFLLLQPRSIILNGYAFLVSRLDGYMILTA